MKWHDDFFFSLSTSTFEEVGWFGQNDARLFEKGKLVPRLPSQNKIFGGGAAAAACEDPLPVISGGQCAFALLASEHLL